jgi:hypothetical protein
VFLTSEADKVGLATAEYRRNLIVLRIWLRWDREAVAERSTHGRQSQFASAAVRHRAGKSAMHESGR